MILSQFEELKELLDFGNALDDGSMKMVSDGRLLTELFKQKITKPVISNGINRYFICFPKWLSNKNPACQYSDFQRPFARKSAYA